MGTVELGKWKRWGLENADGGAWKLGAWKMETVELGKWRRWSRENGIGGAWKMETVELGGFEALWAL